MNMTNPFSVLKDKITELQRGSKSINIKPKVLMITGLEEKIDKKKGITSWVNKYEKTFNSLKPDTISNVHFLLLPREGGISGTIVRKLIKDKNYEELAQLLQNAGFDENDISHFGSTISAIKDTEASQSSQDYGEELKKRMKPNDFKENIIDFIESQEDNDISETIEEKKGLAGGKRKQTKRKKHHNKKKKTKKCKNKYTKRKVYKSNKKIVK